MLGRVGTLSITLKMSGWVICDMSAAGLLCICLRKVISNQTLWMDQIVNYWAGMDLLDFVLLCAAVVLKSCTPVRGLLAIKTTQLPTLAWGGTDESYRNSKQECS